MNRRFFMRLGSLGAAALAVPGVASMPRRASDAAASDGGYLVDPEFIRLLERTVEASRCAEIPKREMLQVIETLGGVTFSNYNRARNDFVKEVIPWLRRTGGAK